MATLDWLVVALFLASVVIGLWRGLVAEVLSLLAWVAAFVLAQWFAPLAGDLLYTSNTDRDAGPTWRLAPGAVCLTLEENPLA